MKEEGKAVTSTGDDAVGQTGTWNGSSVERQADSSVDMNGPRTTEEVVEQAATAASVTSAGDSVDDGASSTASSSKAHHQHHHHVGGGGGGAQGRHHVHIAHHHAAPHHHHYARAHPNMRGGAGRHRSAIGLMRPPSTGAAANMTTTTMNQRGTSTIRGHGRVASSSRLSHASSTSTLPTEDSTHSVSEENYEEVEDEDEDEDEAEQGQVVAARVPDAPATQPTPPPQPKANKEEGKRRAPVTFTMGSMEDESDEEEEDDVAAHKLNGKAASASALAASAKKGDAKAGEEVGDGDSSGDWSSDTSDDPEEDRRREEEKRRKQEQERVDSMFKKIPIRSQSAADVRLLGPKSPVSNEATAAQLVPAARGLLSSMFHPEEERHRHASHAKHASEGLAARRPHASAVDVAHMVRQQPLKDRKVRKGSEGVHYDEHSTHSDVLPRAPSFGNLGALGTLGGGLKMSKSAVALPVLSTLGSRTSSTAAPSTANATDDHKRPSSTHRAVFSGDESENEDEEDATLVAGGASSVAAASGGSSSYAGGSAMDRLNELAHVRSKNKSNRPLSLRSTASEQETAVDRRRMSGGSSTSAGGGGGKRTSLSSLDVQVRPDLEEEAIRQQRRTSMPFETPAVSAPIQLPARSKSAANIPDVGLPQSPRTTRRNMLRDELSESLRQNLLWERQSRNRMLGLGMTSSNAAPASAGPVVTSSVGSHHARSSSADRVTSPPAAQQQQSGSAAAATTSHHRPQSVLGGNALRPLTTRNSSSSGPSNRDSGRYTGDFHHTGW